MSILARRRGLQGIVVRGQDSVDSDSADLLAVPRHNQVHKHVTTMQQLHARESPARDLRGGRAVGRETGRASKAARANGSLSWNVLGKFRHASVGSHAAAGRFSNFFLGSSSTATPPSEEKEADADDARHAPRRLAASPLASSSRRR